MSNSESNLGTKQYTITLDSKEDFHMHYYNLLASFYGLHYRDDIQLTIELSKLADPTTGRIVISPDIRRGLCSKLEIHTTNLSKSISRLKSKGMIFGKRGDFIFNQKALLTQENKNLLEGEGLQFTIKFKL